MFICLQGNSRYLQALPKLYNNTMIISTAINIVVCKIPSPFYSGKKYWPQNSQKITIYVSIYNYGIISKITFRDL